MPFIKMTKAEITRIYGVRRYRSRAGLEFKEPIKSAD